MPKNYAKLRGRIREVYGTQEAFAAVAGIKPATLTLKLNGRTDWKLDEIARICRVLDIPPAEVHQYFFCNESC